MDGDQHLQLNTTLLSHFIQKGQAVQPILVKDIGEMTRLIFDHEEQTILCSSHHFIRKICQFLFLDFKILQERVKDKLGKTQLLPIPLSFRLVLFPLRCSSFSSVKTRGSLWISHRKVMKVQSSHTNHTQTEIVLACGKKLVVPYSKSFVLQQMRDAQLIDYIFQELHYQLPGLNCESEQLLLLADAIRRYST